MTNSEIYRITKVLWPDHFAGPKYSHMVQGREGSWEYKYKSPLNPESFGGHFHFSDNQEPKSVYLISCYMEEVKPRRKTPAKRKS